MDDNANIIIYHTADGSTKIDVRMDGETLWLTQDSVVKDYLTTAADGKNYRTKHYSLDVILAVGYRVKKPERFNRCRKSISRHPKANAEEIESWERQR